MCGKDSFCDHLPLVWRDWCTAPPTFLGGVGNDHIQRRKVHTTAICIEGVFQPPSEFYSSTRWQGSFGSWFICRLHIRSDCRWLVSRTLTDLLNLLGFVMWYFEKWAHSNNTLEFCWPFLPGVIPSCTLSLFGNPGWLSLVLESVMTSWGLLKKIGTEGESLQAEYFSQLPSLLQPKEESHPGV